jgi:hypothetical protein
MGCPMGYPIVRYPMMGYLLPEEEDLLPLEKEDVLPPEEDIHP